MREETRYILSRGDLTRKDFSIQFKNEKGNFYLPIKDTKELYSFNETTFSSKFLEMLSKAGIILHFFNYYGNYVGSFYPKDYLISGNLTVKQAMAYDNLAERMTIAKAIVAGIAVNIHSILYHYYRHGKKDMKDYLDWLKKDIPSIIESSTDIKMLLMIEGRIWARFYESFKYFLPEDFLINKRVRKPPDNPMNALISFGNSLLYTKTMTQIYHTHLNQAISFLHEPSESRFSLSLDLCEVFKPIIVFKTIFECVNNRKLSVTKHFNKELNYALLNDSGRKIFLYAFEERINQVFEHPILKRKITYKQAIKIDGYKLIKYLLENKRFVPFNLEALM